MKAQFTIQRRFLASSPATGLTMVAAASIIPMRASEQADEKKGWTWDIVIMKFGRSSNPADENGYVFVYPKEAASASLEAFEGAKVYANSEGDRAGHKSNPNDKVPKDIIGVTVTDTELRRTLNILPSGSWLRDNRIDPSPSK